MGFGEAVKAEGACEICWGLLRAWPLVTGHTSPGWEFVEVRLGCCGGPSCSAESFSEAPCMTFHWSP